MKPNQSHSHKTLIFAIIALCVLTLIRCTEDPLEISPNILPGDNSLEIYIDSIPVELYTISIDALTARGTGISPLGSVNDNVVGNLQTDFFADFMYAEEPSFANETDLDSISVIDLVLEFVYRHDRGYGDLGSFRVNIY